jgi:hypothetical protein
VLELSTAWGESWIWLGSSLLAAILWATLAWFFRRPRSGAIGEFVTRLTSWRFAPWLLQLLRLLYYVGTPSAALYWGRDAVVEQYLGLRSGADRWLDWVQDLGWAATLGIGTWLVLTLGWWAYRRALAAAREKDAGAGENVSGWVLLREAAYHEIHWAFYRSAPIVALGKYWGTWAGLALVALEAALNPAWRRGLGDPQKAPAQLMRGALAVASSTLFLKAENLWLALALHWGVSWGLAALARALPLPRCEADQSST